MSRADGAGKFRVQTLALYPTFHCDIACHHCLFSSSPKRKGQLPIEVVQRLIAEAVEVSTAREVVVSGGEPFSDFAYLKRVAQASRQAGLVFRAITNGSFATDLDVAVDRLAELQSAGLNRLTLSWDGFHERFLAPERPRTLIAACRRLGIPVLVSLIVTRSQTAQQSLDALGEEGLEVPFIQFRCLPVGRAARKLAAEDLLPPAPRDFQRPCRSDFDSLNVTYDGSVYPCGAVGGFTPGIKLGNYPEASLAELLQRRERELTWVALANCGPTAFLQHASAAELASLGLQTPQHDCVACNRLFSSALGPVLVQRLQAQLRREVEARFDLSGFPQAAGKL